MFSAVPGTLFVSTVARGIRVELGCVVAGWLIQSYRYPSLAFL